MCRGLSIFCLSGNSQKDLVKFHHLEYLRYHWTFTWILPWEMFSILAAKRVHSSIVFFFTKSSNFFYLYLNAVMFPFPT